MMRATTAVAASHLMTVSVYPLLADVAKMLSNTHIEDALLRDDVMGIGYC